MMRCRQFLRAFGSIVVISLIGTGCSKSKPQLVVYCSQDEPYATPLLTEFGAANEVEVSTKFDTESGKSVGLVKELIQERQRPRCDVFWNNEIVSTIRLQRMGVLEPYCSPSAAPYPAYAKAQDGTWHAFGARARVIIVNTSVPRDQWPTSLFDLTRSRWKDKVVMCRPQHGTSATQAACLFAVLGSINAKRYYHGLKNNGIHWADGNQQVAEYVAAGKTPVGTPVEVGVTDTDDAIKEVKAGKPVAIIFPDSKSGPNSRLGTLFIPNTVMLIKGGPNREAGKKLIDHLLSAEVERKLAQGPSHQMPLNPQVSQALPQELEVGRTLKAMEVDFEKAADAWDDVQLFIRTEILTRP